VNVTNTTKPQLQNGIIYTKTWRRPPKMKKKMKTHHHQQPPQPCQTSKSIVDKSKR